MKLQSNHVSASKHLLFDDMQFDLQPCSCIEIVEKKASLFSRAIVTGRGLVLGPLFHNRVSIFRHAMHVKFILIFRRAPSLEKDIRQRRNLAVRDGPQRAKSAGFLATLVEQAVPTHPARETIKLFSVRPWWRRRA
jgi:hypothetical protein